jgi:hypothetical protein
MAVGGGFFGTTVAYGIGLAATRQWARWRLKEWLGEAHRKGVCPVCKGAMHHEGTSPDELL